jgi:hypothetical protein
MGLNKFTGLQIFGITAAVLAKPTNPQRNDATLYC